MLVQMRFLINIVFCFFFIFATGLWAQENNEGTLTKSSEDQEKVFNYDLEPIDGVTISALQRYPNPLANDVSFGITLYPFNAYYNAFALSMAYTRHLSQSWAWSIVDASLFFTTDKDLTTNLAEDFGVEPQVIERLDYLVSSNFHYIHSYGKLIFLKEYIRYYRSSLVFGAGMASTNQDTYVTANLGMNMEFYVNEVFSGKFEMLNHTTVTGESFASINFFTFRFVTSFSF